MSFSEDALLLGCLSLRISFSEAVLRLGCPSPRMSFSCMTVYRNSSRAEGVRKKEIDEWRWWGDFCFLIFFLHFIFIIWIRYGFYFRFDLFIKHYFPFFMKQKLAIIENNNYYGMRAVEGADESPYHINFSRRRTLLKMSENNCDERAKTIIRRRHVNDHWAINIKNRKFSLWRDHDSLF